MIDTSLKYNICKDVINKSGQNNKRTIDVIANAVINDRFLYQIENNELVAFVTWEEPQYVDGKKKVFIENLWIDPNYRNSNYVLKIRTILRSIFKDTRAIWFNRRKQEIIERI